MFSSVRFRELKVNEADLTEMHKPLALIIMGVLRSSHKL